MKLIKLFIEAYPISEERMSGIGHMTLELIKALEQHPDNQKTFEIVLVITRDRKERLEKLGLKTVSYKTIPLPTRIFNIIWKFDLLPPMDWFLGQGVYVFPNYKNWRLASSRSLTFICDIGYLLFPEFVSPKNQKFLAKNVQKWAKRATKVLAISKNAQKEITKHLHVDPQKTLLVPCGVDRSVFYKRSKADIAAFKKTYDIDKEYILYLGNIEPRKNILGLLKAYKAVPATLRQKYALLLVGGSGWLNEETTEAIQTAQGEGYSVIRPSKFIPDDQLPALYSGATALAHPAFYEGFGITPLQAMACGLPVVAANNSSLPEVVGNAALQVNAKDIPDISAKIERILKDKKLRSDLIERGYKRVETFSWHKSADILVREING